MKSPAVETWIREHSVTIIYIAVMVTLAFIAQLGQIFGWWG